MSTISNPIGNLRAWHNTRKTEVAKAPPYHAAIATFEEDCIQLQSQDRDEETPHSFADEPGELQLDTDLRAGEVEIPGLGSLHSTPDGFEVKMKEETVVPLQGGARLTTSSESRAYVVNENLGVIQVVNEVGESWSGNSWNSIRNPGYTESYDIDTGSESIKGYQKTLKS